MIGLISLVKSWELFQLFYVSFLYFIFYIYLVSSIVKHFSIEQWRQCGYTHNKGMWYISARILHPHILISHMTLCLYAIVSNQGFAYPQ